ncbi:RDD family protein [Pseudogracilibacillus sp. SE30717A]|uniref:RDD family protein n=1 Tax=Pseudogracilibacillus sp. SE30717A TaxID=3098293 RepID=UPI00300E0142
MDSKYEDHEEEQEMILSEELNSPKKEYRYAGFWMRYWAYLIDVIIIFSINGILLSPLLFVNKGLPLEIGFWTVNGILAGIVYYVYFLFMTKTFQQTLGKMVLGIKVIKENEDALLWSDILFREVVGRFIYNVIFITKFLYLVIAFSNEKQGIHDMIGNTRVVHI